MDIISGDETETVIVADHQTDYLLLIINLYLI